LIIVVDDAGAVEDGYVVADTIQLHLSNVSAPDLPAGLCSLIYTLVACYYAWDLSYPKTYQMLVLFHQHIFKDTKEKMFKSLQLIKLEKQLNVTNKK